MNSFQILVQYNKNKKFISVSDSETIGQVKSTIASQFNVPVKSQRLVSSGKQLDDSKTIGEYGIQPASTVYLVSSMDGGSPTSSSSSSFQILVQYNKVKKFITVDVTEPIANVKNTIASQFNVPVKSQRLVSSGKQLDDSRTVGDYGIQPASTVYLVSSMDGGSQF